MCAFGIILFPEKRLPIRKIGGYYSLVTQIDRLLIPRFGFGEVKLMRFKRGDIEFINHAAEEPLEDMENIGDETVILNIIEFKALNRFTDSLNIKPSE